MARLPQPGGDKGNWGVILNDYLSQSLDVAGSLKDDVVGSNQLQDNSVTSNAIAPGAVTKSTVGLSNVTNTADVDKPVSTAQQAALDEKADNAAVATVWMPTQSVTTTSVRQAPDGSWIKSNANRTTGATFDATEQTFWTPVLTTAGTLDQVALSATIMAEVPAASPFVPRSSAVKYKPIVGVIRKVAGAWATIDDTNHTPTNITSVEIIDDLRIRVHYGFTSSRVGFFSAWVDETYAYQGYHLGASVNRDYADLYVYQTRNVGGYVSWDGSAWVSLTSNEFRNISFTGGTLYLEHDDVGSSSIINLSGRGAGNYLYRSGSFSGGITRVEVRNLAGALVTTPAVDMKLSVDRGVTRRTVAPSAMGEGNSNLWISGLMEA